MDVTPRSKVEKSKGRPRSPPVHQIWCNSKTLFPELRYFEKKWHTPFRAIQAIFSSVIVVTAQVGTFVPGKRSKVKWSYKIETNISSEVFCRGISNFGYSLSKQWPSYSKKKVGNDREGGQKNSV